MTIRRLPQPRTRMLSVHRIKEMISKGEIQLDAPYQREIIWESNKMSELIDSIINNYYIPPLIFAVRQIRGKQVRIVIDGKQRLTSARRFLKNLLPYIDSSKGRAICKYYSPDADKDSDDEREAVLRTNQSTPEDFLNDEEFKMINKFEFVCIEYMEISEDDEFEIFSRVQLGVAITSAEKLKATNSKVAEQCRLLADENSQISSVLQRKGHPALFQLIAHLMLTIKNGTEMFAAQKGLQQFVQSSIVPPTVLVDKVEFVLSVMKSIAVDKDMRTVITKSPNGNKGVMKAIEFIMFGVYISLVERTRTIRNFSRDFEALRQHLINTREGRAYLGKEAFLESMVWVNERLEKENLISAQVNITIPDDDDFDELKEEENGPIPNYDDYINMVYPAANNYQFTKPPQKRRRDERIETGVAVAKRGGKLPSGVLRRRS